jgi:uncharacterized DUF497 family protein
VRFDWDAGNRNHIKQHGVTAEEAEEALSGNLLHVSMEVRGIEIRLTGLGLTKKGRLLFVVYTAREKRIRVVTARDASRKEKKSYAEYQKIQGS